ncbi:hypothetical protein [Cytobacillus kochii]|uniref:Uncharacterized protein n=1 Tax=Cytobacillus kochii TaxID=859143 RepID=A0A248TLI2_9BACI|nr:hypothetical protein [Cytobacillus kochii]ASV69073.1 hypothetical protein CKF48_18270 [Cytobacillus kochii]
MDEERCEKLLKEISTRLDVSFAEVKSDLQDMKADMKEIKAGVNRIEANYTVIIDELKEQLKR